MIEFLAFLIMAAIFFVYSAPDDDFEGEDQ